jgi:hypothetical protein
MKFQKSQAILLSLVSTFGTACLSLCAFTNSAQAAECPNIAGAFQRSNDNLIIYWEQDGCNISSSAPSKIFDHVIKGRWTGNNFSVTTTRRNIKDGCTTQMYGRLYKLENSQIRTEVYGTDGRCDLPANYTENSVWTAR